MPESQSGIFEQQKSHSLRRPLATLAPSDPEKKYMSEIKVS